MSNTFLILDSDEEQEEQVKSSQLDYDEPLFQHSAQKADSKRLNSDEFDSFLSSLKSDNTQQEATEISDQDDQLDLISATDNATNKDTSRYAKYLQDESPEASPSPPASPKKQKKRSLKKPTPSKKQQQQQQQQEREDSIDSFIDDSEQVVEQDERENSVDDLVLESQRLLASDTGKKKRTSLKNPISHKKQSDSIDDDDDDDDGDDIMASTSSSAHKRDDSLDRILASSSSKKRRDSIDDILYSSPSKRINSLDDDDDDDDDLQSVGNRDIDVSSQKKAKRQDSFEYEGDYMGRDKSSPLRKKQPESIDLLSDNDSDHQEIKPKPSISTRDDDKPRKFKPSSRLKVAQPKTDRPRKSSIDLLIDGEDDMPASSPPKEMPARARPKPSYEKMLHDSDSSPESSPTLEPKKVVKKRKRPSSELSDEDIDATRNKSNKATLNLDDSDEDPIGSKSDNDSLSITRSNAFDNNNKNKNNDLSDDDHLDGLDSDSFFDNLLTMKKTGRTDSVVNKRSALESVASSSKSTSIYMDLDDDDNNNDDDNDDEPVIIDRKGKKRADAIRPLPPRKRQSSLDDEDALTPKEKRQLQSAKKKEEAQRKREEKNRLKEEKKREKEQQALFEKANKIKSNRNDILKEMIMDIHPSFLITKPGQIIQQVMESKEAEVCPLSDECLQSISWRRKCTAEWDMDSQSFHPLSQTKLVEEPVVLLFFQVNRFIQHIMDDTLEGAINKVKTRHRNKQLMVMIEGLETYYKKKKLSESHQFQKMVRQRINENDTESTASNGRKKKKTTSIYETGPKKDQVEKVLVELQMMKDVMLLPTKSDDDSASWLESLTIDLALGRYKSKNINNTYRVTRTGKGTSDTFFKMLQEVHLCTPAVAKSIMSTYPSAQSLYQAYKRTSRGSELLADLEVERSAVQVRDRTINKVMSKKMHSIFTSTDPEYVIF